MVPRSWWRFVWGLFGYIMAACFIVGLAIIVRCGGLNMEYQRIAIAGLLSMAVVMGYIYALIRRGRSTHHEFWNGKSKFREDIGPGEQKCLQFMIIFFLTAGVIILDILIP